MGVPEVWHYDDNRLRIFRLVDTVFVEQEASTALHNVTGAEVSRFLEESRTLERLAWLRRVRAWARAHRQEASQSR